MHFMPRVPPGCAAFFLPRKKPAEAGLFDALGV
jgi:hypothetical protein